jgi:predicted nuclease of predicted toxin-antitoxin system
LPRRIVTDENINCGEIVKRLIDEKFDFLSVLKHHGGISDQKVLELAIQNDAILVTEDSDFGKWVFAHKKRPVCVIFLKYEQSDIRLIVDSLIKVLRKTGEDLADKFFVITPRKIRVRIIP